VTLTTDDVERVAQRAAELVRDELAALLDARALDRATALVDAQTVAAALGVSRKFVYSRVAQLGGRRVAGGPLRFDLAVALAADIQAPAAPEMRPTRPRRLASSASVPLLPIRGAVNGR
jgi:hypothetical protein